MTGEGGNGSLLAARPNRRSRSQRSSPFGDREATRRPAPETAEPDKAPDPKGQTIRREFVRHRADAAKLIELFWAKPEAAGPWPAVVFVHGHQDVRNRIGGTVYAETG